MMIKHITIFFSALLLNIASWAQTPVDKLHVENIEIELTDGKVTVRFDGILDKKAISKDETLWVRPVITDGTNRVALAHIFIRGRRADISLHRRMAAASDQLSESDLLSGPLTVTPGAQFTYRSQADYQWWMSGGSIEIETLLMGCCNTVEGDPRTVASDILPAGEPEIIVLPEADTLVETTGEKLDRTFSFVLPASEFDPDNLVVYDEDRENAIIVYYRLNESTIRDDHMDNHRSLVNLYAAIKLIQESGDSKVQHIVVAGFASPEGPFELNDRLAYERAVSVKNYIISRTDIDPGIIHLKNGSADWRGLTILIENSDMPDKQEILNIIRTVPVWDTKAQKGRMGEIMRYKNGRAYNYMKEHFFPKLRNGAFIRVYYDNLNQNLN